MSTTIARAGISFNYEYVSPARAKRRNAKFKLEKDVCLVGPVNEFGLEPSEALPEFIAISQRTGRAGGGEDAAAAYAQLLFNIVDAMKFFAEEAEGHVDLIVTKPLQWHKHAVWNGPSGKSSATAYPRLSSLFNESYEEAAIRSASQMIKDHLNITVSANTLTRNALEKTIVGRVLELSSVA